MKSSSELKIKKQKTLDLELNTSKSILFKKPNMALPIVGTESPVRQSQEISGLTISPKNNQELNSNRNLIRTST